MAVGDAAVPARGPPIARDAVKGDGGAVGGLLPHVRAQRRHGPRRWPFVLLNQVSLKDKKKFQCGDSHEGLLQPPRGSKGRCAKAEGPIKNRRTAGHPQTRRFCFGANLVWVAPLPLLQAVQQQGHESPHWKFRV